MSLWTLLDSRLDNQEEKPMPLRGKHGQLEISIRSEPRSLASAGQSFMQEVGHLSANQMRGNDITVSHANNDHRAAYGVKLHGAVGVSVSLLSWPTRFPSPEVS